MRVIIDTNVFLSYMLAPTTQSTVATVIITCLSQDEIILLLPSEQIAEFATKAATKQYFRERIPHNAIAHFVAQLTSLAELLPPLEKLVAYSRDLKDDYLVAYGVVNDADYLITGDSDLLVLGQVGQMGIIKPAQFIAVLRMHGFLS